MATRSHRMKFIDRVFVVMHVTYGHLWSSLFPTDDMLRVAKAQWALQLAPWSESAIEKGLDRCRRAYERPPTLPQFMNLLRTDPAHQQVTRALPRPPCNPDKVQAEIANMRAALAGVK